MTEPTRDRLLDAALPHVAFDGWSAATFAAAAADAGLPMAEARAACPRGAADLAADYHRRGDAAMVAGLAGAGLADLRFRERVALAVWLRLQAADREVVRRGAALFALPLHAPEGARLVWGTADAIWTALGDRSDDLNWYTKRGTLSAVYAATVLFWLGDDSPGQEATRAFLDRRIEDVMRFEKAKAQARDNPALKGLTGLADRVFAGVRAPAGTPDMPLPGRWKKG